MPQTNPFHMMAPRKLTDTELASAIRLDIEAELDAINLYQAHIDATDNEGAKKVIAYIRDEEKEHAGMFLALLRTLDPQQYAEVQNGPRKVDLILAGAGKDEIEDAGQSAPAPAKPETRALTVGGLRASKA